MRTVTRSRVGERLTPTFLVGAGLLAGVTAGFEVLTETRFVGSTTLGGLVEVLLLAVPAVGLVYAGYWLETGEFDADDVWRIGTFAVGGALVAAAATFGLLLIAAVPTMDPAATFVLFVGTGTEGSLLGVLAGTFATTAGRFRRERATADEFETLNALLRHDLRNRLTLLRAHLTALAEDPAVDHDRVGRIEAQLDAVQAIVEDVGAVAKGLRGGASEPVDLVSVARQRVSLLEAGYEGVAVETDLPDEAVVAADDRLASALDNVLSNAVVHNDRAEAEIAVTIAVNGDDVRLAVADNGPGIPAERRERAFEPGIGDGTGMGLYLVRAVVESYGGRVELAANEPRGTVVRLALPRAGSTRPAQPA